ncbi:MAG TPA: hypothetical protein VG317_16875 [Pseudonocardiaceae bacterium]|jgi:hypothetical protein|nr:hypothetical protein [Pseudonocardiaceae bacterium]
MSAKATCHVAIAAINALGAIARTWISAKPITQIATAATTPIPTP